HERPIADLVDALRTLGAQIHYARNEGFPPLSIGPAVLSARETVRIRGDISSQFLSALLMALPLAGGATTIEIAGELVSKPYADMTLASMQRFGVAAQREGWARFVIPARSRYASPGTIGVEGDASSASYFLAAGAIAAAVVALFADSPSTLRNIGSWRVKETDRIAAMAAELAKLGAGVAQGSDWLRVTPPEKIRPATIETYDDHRMAMSFSLASLG